MGVELWPTAMAEPMPSYEVEVTKKALADILPQFKVRCDETELKSLRSLPSYYRLVDAEATAFLEDAKKIGWRFQQVKAWDDVVVYQARWHAQSRAVVFDFQPARLSIGVCRLVPIAPAPAAKPAR